MNLKKRRFYCSSFGTYFGWKYRQRSPDNAMMIRITPTTSQTGTNPILWGISTDGTASVDECVGRSVETSVGRETGDCVPVALPVVMATAGKGIKIDRASKTRDRIDNGFIG